MVLCHGGARFGHFNPVLLTSVTWYEAFRVTDMCADCTMALLQHRIWQKRQPAIQSRRRSSAQVAALSALCQIFHFVRARCITHEIIRE